MYLDDNKNFDVLIFVEMQSERILKRSAVHTYRYLFAGGGEGIVFALNWKSVIHLFIVWVDHNLCMTA